MSADEELDVLDASGAVIGTKTRAEVHRDHDWHGLVFVWSCWLEADTAVMLMQRRGRPGDRFAAQVDALAGGHIASGESPRQAAVRELAEEVGLTVAEDDLVELGTMRMERPDAECRRVIEHLVLLPEPIDIGRVAFTDEVDGFALIGLDELDYLIEARQQAVAARVRDATGDDVTRLPRSAVAAYPPEILETFRRSIAAIRHLLENGDVDPRLISG